MLAGLDPSRERKIMESVPAESRWSDVSLLKGLKNPSEKTYKILIRNPEVTFLGANNQPDFARVTIVFFPGEKIIELKSLKFYFYAFRNRLLSYERFVNVLYEDLSSVYAPARLKVIAKFRPRGGIESTLVVDSQDR
jgi:7-cyano-7-deazaguanine reductase